VPRLPLIRSALRARPRRRVRLDNDERRAQLLALARRAFSESSYDEVSIDDLARAAKISKGLLYHYFPTKRDLYVAGLRQIADDLVAAITRVPEDAPPIERVRAGLDAYLDYVAQHARAFRSLMRGGIGSDPEVAEVVESVRARLFDRFLRGAPLAPVLAASARMSTAIRGWIGFVEAASIDWCAPERDADPSALAGPPARASSARLTRAELRDLLAQVLFEALRVAAPDGVAGARAATGRDLGAPSPPPTPAPARVLERRRPRAR
jgi:AcrR family transcriptional regulator